MIVARLKIRSKIHVQIISDTEVSAVSNFFSGTVRGRFRAYAICFFYVLTSVSLPKKVILCKILTLARANAIIIVSR